MRDPSPRAPFDQGLFLKHFNKGKALYDEKRHEEAERELEEAYLLRPRDQKVLNLLGLVYFKQDKYDKAEEVYRKLAAESPDAHTLFYNLGLIYFKLGRLEEAETAFMKALELNKDNPKINFYLGLDLRAPAPVPGRDLPVPAGGGQPHGAPRRGQDRGRPAGARPAPAKAPSGSGDTKPVLAVRPPKPKPDDTAEFLAQDVARGLEEMENTLPPNKTLRPVSDILLSQNAPRRNLDTDTARFRLPPGDDLRRLPPPPRPPRRPSARTELPAEHTLPPRRNETFRFLENNLMEIDFSGKVFIKQGTIYSYGGNLTFWVKDRRPGRPARARDHHRHRQGDPHRQGPRGHLHAGPGRDDLRRARAPPGLRGEPHAALRPGGRRRPRVSRCWPSRAAGWWPSPWRASRWRCP